jgi:ABC-type multidrug transport system ATPase subunit
MRPDEAEQPADATRAMPPIPEPDIEPEPFLVAERISASGPEGGIFADLTVRARRGELVALVGESGTGRTSALLSLSGRFIHGAGTVTVDGDSHPRRVRERVAVAQAPPAIFADENHTVAQLISETELCEGIEAAAVRAGCRDLGVGADTGATYGHLPKVERTLLSLAFAAATGKPVITIDDTDSGINDASAARVWEALRALADGDRLVLAACVRGDDRADQTIRIEGK